MDVNSEYTVQPRRSPWIAIAVLVIIVAIAAALWWMLRPPYIEPAEATPANALAFVALDVKPAVEPGSKLNRIWQLAKNKGFDDTLKSGIDKVIKDYGSQFDVQKDLLDWCGGEIAMAMLPAARGDMEVALLITVRDLKKAKKTLRKVRAAFATDTKTFRASRYRGVRVLSGRLGLEPVACAVVGRLIVLGDTATGIRAVIDAVRDGKSLARAKAYQTAMKQVPEEALVRTYWTTPEADVGLDTGAQALGKRLLRSLLAFREQRFRAAAAAFSLDDGGVRIEATSLYKSAVKPLALPACTGEVVKHLPDSTAAVAVFGSPEAYWSLLRSLPERALAPILGSEPGKAIDNIEAIAKEATGYGLREGWLSWMNSESAIALTRARLEPIPGLAVILGTDQPNKMKSAITALRSRAALIPGLMMTTPDIAHSTWLDSLTMVNVPVPMAAARPVIATAENAAVVTSDAETISSLLPRPGQTSLSNAAKYQRARAALPDTPAAFLYVDTAAAFKIAEHAGLLDISDMALEDPVSLIKGLESFAIGFDAQPLGQRVVLWLGLDWENLFAGLGAPGE